MGTDTCIRLLLDLILTVCVGHEAAKGVCMDLVGEGPRMQQQLSLMVAALLREEEVGVSIH